MNALLLIAAAAAVCGSSSDIKTILDKLHHEHVAGRGFAGDGRQMYELYLSRDGKTFSVVMTLPEGTSCLIAAGENWQRLFDRGTAL